MACDMSKPCKFPPLDSCQKMFVWTHKGVDLVPHPVVEAETDSEQNLQYNGTHSLLMMKKISATIS